MRILITSGGNQRCAVLADQLAQSHEVRLSERVHVETAHEFVQCALGHDRSTNLLTRGMNAIVHAVEPLPDEDVSAQIDAASRCTYNLLMAAVEEGVPQVVLLSTLELMADYPSWLSRRSTRLFGLCPAPNRPLSANTLPSKSAANSPANAVWGSRSCAWEMCPTKSSQTRSTRPSHRPFRSPHITGPANPPPPPPGRSHM